MKGKFICYALAAALLACPSTAQQRRTIQTQTNIVFGMHSGLALLMDVLRPEGPNGFAVLYVPGSAWQAPTVRDAPQLKDSAAASEAVQALLGDGFTVFVVNHRAAPTFRFPAAVEDVQRAARYIRAHAADFGVRADRIAAFGGSSGGNLVAMLATLGEGSEHAIEGGRERPACVATAMAPLDLRPLGTDGLGVGYAVSYIGHPPAFEGSSAAEVASFDPAYAAASPITHVSAKSAPMLLLHGDKDLLVPLDQAERFASALKAAGGQAELIRMDGVGHQLPKQYAVRAAAWLKRCMDRK